MDKNKHSQQFVSQLGVKQVIEMFDLISDILFWVKDKNGQFVYANNFFLEHLGVNNLSQIIGLTDLDFSPKHIAHQFMNDDKKVLCGELVTDRLEMNHTKNGEVAWFTTSKRPLFDDNGQAIGSYGISRHLERTSVALSGMDALKVPVTYVRQNYMQDITLEELASVTHLSISALERRFKKYLNTTPKQFINQIRLENARRLLVETSQPIAQIASDTGFGDHSYFSRQFKKLFGELPSDFRAQHTASVNS